MITLIKSFTYDNQYDYIKTFSTESEQTAYFNLYNKIYIEDDVYIKEHETFLVPYNYDFLVNEGVNYVVFNNGYKDIYAFIIKKEYVNLEATRLIFEIDVIQTYMFDFTILKSFIERKNCSIQELTDFDEGLEIGEHIIEQNTTVLNKESTYFAMFSGFKEQELIFDGLILKSVVDLPFSSSKPLTIVDGVQYPLYFMPLKEAYKEASYEQINTNMSGETYGGGISAKILRFIKGYEGFAPFPNYFNGESFRTGGYGITENYQSKYYALLGDPPIPEQKASEILAQMMRNEFGNNLYLRMLRDGKIGSDILQRHFDAFVSLAMNGGMGAVTTSPMFSKWLVNPEDSTIYSDWLSWYIRGDDGVLPGLVSRRQEEANIYKDGIYLYRTIGIYDIAGNLSGNVTENNGHGFMPPSVNGDV